MKSTSFRNAIMTSSVFLSTMFATSDLEAQARRNPAPTRRPVPAKKDTVPVRLDAQGRPIPPGYVPGGIGAPVPDTAAARIAKEADARNQANNHPNGKPQTLRTRIMRAFDASNSNCQRVKDLPDPSTYVKDPDYMMPFRMCVSFGGTADTLHIFSHNDEAKLSSRASIELPEIDPDSVASVLTHGIFVKAKSETDADGNPARFAARHKVSEGMAVEHTAIGAKFSILADYNTSHSGVTVEADVLDLVALATHKPLVDRYTVQTTEKMSPRDAQKAFSRVVTQLTRRVDGRDRIDPDFTPVENFLVYVADEVVKRGEIGGVKLPQPNRMTYRLPTDAADSTDRNAPQGPRVPPRP